MALSQHSFIRDLSFPETRKRDGSTQSGIHSQVPTRRARPELRGNRRLNLWCQRQHGVTYSPAGRLVRSAECHAQRCGNLTRNLSPPDGHEYQLPQPTTDPKAPSHARVVSSQFIKTSTSFAQQHICCSVRFGFLEFYFGIPVQSLSLPTCQAIEQGQQPAQPVQLRSQLFDCLRTFRTLL